MFVIISLLTLTGLLVLAGRCFQQQQDLNSIIEAHNALEYDVSVLEKHVQALSYIELKVTGDDADEPVPYVVDEEVADAAA